jgi:polysaccharide export outer membrane protein
MLRFASLHFFAMASLIAAMGGCRKPVEMRTLPSPVVSRSEEQLDPVLLKEVMGERKGDAYRVGAGDTVLVAVYGHPQLSIGQYTGTAVSGRPTGLVVDNDGTIQLPLIGSVAVLGNTAEQMRQMLESKLAVFVKEPKVTVQVIFNGSIRYYLLGQFTNPGLKFSDRPLHLLEALSLGGSVLLEHASLRGAYIARNGRRLPINFQRLVREGDLAQNIPLRSGDVIFVPDRLGEQAFVFGGAASSNPQGGAVPFVNGRLTLLQALAQAGFGVRERVQTKLSKTIVIRSDGERGQYFVVDAKKMLDGEVAQFDLSPGDVVLVPNRAFTTFNEGLAQILPTLQTVAGLLQPFVQIKFLREGN